MPTEADEALVEAHHIVRALIARQVRDADLVDDMTQETVVRVASARPRLADSAVRAYAIVTARNVIVAHLRAQGVAERHAHRLVDGHSVDGPEPVALAREEIDAIAAALERLQPVERELLLRYEAGDVDLETLAEDHTTSPASMSMRLSRARAVLRLEFLLAFRHIQLPQASCRAVLLALSTGDKRRQTQLDVPGHLLRCATCSGLARPVTERNRGIAGWFIVPAAEFLRRLVSAIRRRPTQVAASILAVAAITAAAFVVTNRDQPDGEAANTSGRSAAVDTSRAASPTVVTSSVASAVVPPAVASSPATEPTTRPATTTTPPCGPAQPLDQISPTTPLGCPFARTALVVDDVPLDEGFWAITPNQETVLVQMVGTGESPVDVVPGMTITMTGVTATPPADITDIGLETDDPHIGRVAHYLEVRYQDLQAP